jgi:dTDP-glucose pyrophosphorylase
MPYRLSITDSCAFTISDSSTLRDAMEMLDASGLGCICIVDQSQRLLGLMTDGDVRRALLTGNPITTLLSSMSLHSPLSLRCTENTNAIEEFLLVNEVKHVPLLDHDNRVVSVAHLRFDSVILQTNFVGLIMAGGFGTRLYPLTQSLPKPLLKVNGEPVIDRLIRNFVRSGITNIYIALHYMADKITEHVGDGSKYGASVVYIVEQSPLGTAGAVNLMPMETMDKHILMTLGDLVTSVDFIDIINRHTASDSSLTVVTREIRTKIPFGVLDITGGRITGIVEKPTFVHYVNAGILGLSPRVRDLMKSKVVFGQPEIITEALEQHLSIEQYLLGSDWTDMGTHDDYKMVNS